MSLPEIKNDLIKRYNPNNFDLYECTFGVGGELQAYSERIRVKLMQIKEG